MKAISRKTLMRLGAKTVERLCEAILFTAWNWATLFRKVIKYFRVAKLAGGNYDREISTLRGTVKRMMGTYLMEEMSNEAALRSFVRLHHGLDEVIIELEGKKRLWQLTSEHKELRKWDNYRSVQQRLTEGTASEHQRQYADRSLPSC